MHRVSVQEKDFDLGAELALLRASTDIGALVSFSGLVRQNDSNTLDALELEHYPGMTESSLSAIAQTAQQKWPLQASTIIHRIGRLEVGAQIMMVATASAHRAAAFEAAEFLMDYLKSRAPFWKKEHSGGSAEWVDARVADEAALGRWGKF